MGYQESLLRVNRINQKNFIKEICNIPEENWNMLCELISVITMKKDIEELKIKKGDMLLYIAGERSAQRDIKSFLYNNYNKSKVVKKLNFSYKFIPIEDCLDYNYYLVGYGKKENKYAKIEDFSLYKQEMSFKKENNIDLEI